MKLLTPIARTFPACTIAAMARSLARDGYLLEADIPLSVAAAARLWDHFTR